MKANARIETITDSSLEEAAALIRAGQLVAFPTETVYGLGADATNDQAVARIFDAKGRPDFNPLIVHVKDLEQARRHAVVGKTGTQLVQKFWPGAMTLVLQRSKISSVSQLASAGLETVAVRSPIHPAAHRLLELATCPIAAPSANRSGYLSPTTAEHVAEDLGENVTLILDGGPCSIGVESTIIDLSSGNPYLLRPGGVPLEEIECEVGPLGALDTSVVRAPGMLPNHYAPNTPIRLTASHCQENEALLAFGPNPIAGAKITENLSPKNNLVEAAGNLFAMLHKLDASGCSTIAAMPIPEHALGLTINDRLRRAASLGEGSEGQ